MMTIKEKFWYYLGCAKLFKGNKVEVKRTLSLAKMYREMLETSNFPL